MRAAKLAQARKMLKEHQEKKQVPNEKNITSTSSNDLLKNEIDSGLIEIKGVSNVTENILSNYDPLPKHENIDTLVRNPDVNYINQHYECNLKLEQQIKAMEILTINKRQLEIQVCELQNKMAQIEAKDNEYTNNCNKYQQQIHTLQVEVKNLKDSNTFITKESINKNKLLEEQHATIASLTDLNNNLSEQIDITKTALMAREAENASLQSLLNNLQNKLDVTELHLQQLSHGSLMDTEIKPMDKDIAQENATLLQKVSYLEQQLKCVQNEKEQITIHFEQYVNQLNEQLSMVTSKNAELMNDTQMLSNRENSLIEQISHMEIQIQQLREASVYLKGPSKPEHSNTELDVLQERYKELEVKLIDVQKMYDEAKEQLVTANQTSRQEYPCENVEDKHSHMAHDVNIKKLNADIVSDKLAAQMATAQNKQLKAEVEDLKEVYIKTSRDKLELIEKLDAEKFLNRELTLKLSEIEQTAKETYSKLMAKDEEMIRLLSSYTELEKTLLEKASNPIKETDSLNNGDCTSLHSDTMVCDYTKTNDEDSALLEAHKNTNYITEESNNALNISIKDAMLRLQDRFLKNMKEVAELSDEKHRLEHIIGQLQGETDTIAEYVALYQQQRGILKKREEERKEQLKIFETERDRMKNQLNELSNSISQFAVDKDLQEYFQQESRKEEVSKIINLVAKMKNNHLVDTSKSCSDYDSFYPCSWCSGKVIIV